MFYAKQISTNQMVTGSHSVPDPSQVFPNVDVSDIETGEISESDFIAHVELTNELTKTYSDKRKAEYPPATDYLDGIVKGDQGQIDKYIADCLAVKQRHPK